MGETGPEGSETDPGPWCPRPGRAPRPEPLPDGPGARGGPCKAKSGEQPRDAPPSGTKRRKG
eukprot:8801018-Pyramimonas_sp.AAC.1